MRHGATSGLAACCLTLVLGFSTGCRHLVVLEEEVRGESIRAKYENAFEWVESFEGAEVPEIAFRPGGFDERRIGTDGLPRSRATTDPPRETLLSFIHMSDAQLRDERIRLGGRTLSRILDRRLPVTEYGEDQQRYDGSVYLTLIETLNRHAAGFERAASPEERRRFPLFMIHTGDSIHAGVLQELYEFLWITARLDLPWLQVVGNHDVTAFGTELFPVTVKDPRLGYFPLYESELFIYLHGNNTRATRRLVPPGIFLSPPQMSRHEPTWVLFGNDHRHGFDRRREVGYYSVTPGIGSEEDGVEPETDAWWRPRLREGFEVRFLVLDTTADGERHKGGIDPEGPQMAWLRDELGKAREAREHVAVFGHHDLKRSFRRGGEELAELFAGQPGFLGYFCGHTHKQEMRVIGSQAGAYFWQIIGPPIIEWPQAGLSVRLVRLEDGDLAWDLTPFRDGFERRLGETLDVDAADPTERLRAQVLLGRESAREDYHRGDPEEEVRRPPVRLVIPAAPLSP